VEALDAALGWLSDNRLLLGEQIARGVEGLTTSAPEFFGAVSEVLGQVILGLTALLFWFHPLVLVTLTAGLAWYRQRSVGLVLFVFASLLLIINMGYWDATLETLSLVLCATLCCVLVGVPLGIAAAHRPRLAASLAPLLDLMQTIPTFVYLIPTLILFGLGVVPGLISTVVFALPAPIRLTALGIAAVPKPLLEAGQAFGATRWQLLWKVELPGAMPSIMAGVTQCIMLSLSMVVIAALVGADGLGKPVVRALNSVNIADGFEAGLSIVIVAIVLDRLCKPRVAAQARDPQS
jgi:glycine betaine/proline transport system permease protein